MEFQVSFDSGDQFSWPVNPEKVSIVKDGRRLSYASVRTGDYPVAAGWSPEQVQFSVLLPGKGRTATMGLKNWQSPQHYIGLFEAALLAARSRAYLTCTDLDLSAWYQITHTQQDFDSAQGSALGDVEYTLAFSEERIPTVYTTTGTGAPPQGVASNPQPSSQLPPNVTGPSAPNIIGPPAPPPNAPNQPRGALQANYPPSPDGTPQAGTSYVIQPGDTLTSIDLRAFGAAATPDTDVPALCQMLGISDPDTIQPGWVLNVPRLHGPNILPGGVFPGQGAPSTSGEAIAPPTAATA